MDVLSLWVLGALKTRKHRHSRRDNHRRAICWSDDRAPVPVLLNFES